MSFKANDANHPSKNRGVQKSNYVGRKKNTAHTPSRRNVVLKSIFKGVGVAEACRRAGVRDRTAPSRWIKQPDPLHLSTVGSKKKLDSRDRSILYRIVEKDLSYLHPIYVNDSMRKLEN